MSIKITKGNNDDRTPIEELNKKLKGSIYADLFKVLYTKGLKPITGIRKTYKKVSYQPVR